MLSDDSCCSTCTGLVARSVFNGPLDSISVYNGPSPRERGKE